MNGFSFFMTIFGLLVFLLGLYIYTGHDVKSLLWKAPYKNLTKKEWKKIGKWTMITSIIAFMIAIIIYILSIK